MKLTYQSPDRSIASVLSSLGVYHYTCYTNVSAGQ